MKHGKGIRKTTLATTIQYKSANVTRLDIARDTPRTGSFDVVAPNQSLVR